MPPFFLSKKNFLSRGITFIESLVTVFIFILIFGAVSAFLVMAYQSQGYSWQQAVAIDEARKGIETMIREIREARPGDDGSYPIEKAEDKEFIFYSDIDKDGQTERVRYFLGTVNSDSQTQTCVTFLDGGSCEVNFANFFSGELELAEVKVSVEGDFGRSNEYAEIYADGKYLGRICQTGCSDCAGVWQGTKTFDVRELALDNFLQLVADASPRVNDFCDWEEENHAMKARFELNWSEVFAQGQNELKKGVIDPTEQPISYPLDQEKVRVLTSYVRNLPPIFRYFDAQGQELIDLPARLKDTKVMEVYLVINVNPNRPPQDFELRSAVQLRNLKSE